MNRRHFLGAFLAGVSAWKLGALAQDKKAAAPAKKAGGKPNVPDWDQLKDLKTIDPKASANSFFKETDSVTVQQYCNASIPNNPKCPARATRQNEFCGNCQFFQNRSKFENDLAGNCQLIPPQGDKKYVQGKFWCQTWVKGPNQYSI